MRFATYHFSSHGSWEEKDFRKEVGKCPLGVGFAVVLAGAQVLCTDEIMRGRKVWTQRETLHCFHVIWGEFQQRTGRFDILREGLGIHWLLL